MSKHTPGPWIVFGDWAIQDKNNRLIAQFEPLNDDGNGNSEESFANADLIAAAPELLEALQNLTRMYYGEDRQDYAGQYAQAALAAIAKATGGQQ